MSKTNVQDMILKFPEGIFKGKEPRITKEYVSVYDIISVAGNQKNPRKVWERLKEMYNEEVVSFCYNLKFPGPGQRETPCINAKGLVKLLMWIPGKLAQEFRNQTADIMIRYLGGDTTLINEIKVTNNLHIQNGENDIFRQALKTRKLLYDERYHMYVRTWSPFFEDQQKNLKCDEKVIKLGLDKIKFGIAKYLDGRESSYGNDHGYFQFSIELPSKDCALFIEKIARQEFKNLTVGNTYEYLYSKKLAKHFGIIKSTKNDLEKRDYYLTAKKLYSKMLSDFHMYYPDEKNNFGITNHPKVETDCDYNTIITNSVITLSEDKLPDYILKECIIENEIKIEKEIKKEIIELNKDDEKLIDELENIKKSLARLTNLVKEKAPDILKEYTEEEIKGMEHKKKYKQNRIFQYSLDGKFLKSYDSTSAAADFHECSTKIIRISCQNHKSFQGFLWRSTSEVKDESNLPHKRIQQCDPDNFKIIKTYENFLEISKSDLIKKEKNIDKSFILNEIYRAIDLGIIYNDHRWKFENEELTIGQAMGRTGKTKRVAKLNDKKEVLEIFKSLEEATKKCNLKSKASISIAVSKNMTANGFYWKYLT